MASPTLSRFDPTANYGLRRGVSSDTSSDFASPPQQITPAPDPQVPSGQDIVRGVSSIGLTPEGVSQMRAIGAQYAKHGLDGIISSDLPRSIQSAQAVSEATGAPILDQTPAIATRAMGGLEGQPVKDVKDEIIRQQTTAPNYAPPGRGELSLRPGESTNQYNARFLPYMDNLAQAWRQLGGKSRIAVINHYTGVKTLEAYVAAGQPDDYSIDPDELQRRESKPGDAYRIDFRDLNDPKSMQITKTTPDDPAPGIFVNRHGMTAWNGEADGAQGEAPESSVQAAAPLATAAGEDQKELSQGGMSVQDQANHYRSLVDIMRTPGFSRMPKAARVKIQNARFALQSKLPVGALGS
jgi:broad specificity phosphatase PhoE